MDTIVARAPVRLSMAREAVLIGAFLLLCIMPMFVKQQLLTGSAVNAMLLITAIVAGPSHAAVLGVFPSMIAAVSGLLPPMLVPFIPCIAVANAAFVYLFAAVHRVNRAAALVIAAFAKFGLLSLFSTAVIATILPENVSRAAVSMMSWPQLFTAFAGGAIALAVLWNRRVRS